MRRLQRSGRAGRAGRGADPEVAHVVEDRLALDILKAHVGGVGQTVHAVAVDARIRTGGEQAVFQLVAQARERAPFLIHVRSREVNSFAETHDVRHVFRAAAPSVLLMAAQHEGFESRAAPQVEDANAFGRVQLVSGDRKHVDRQALHVDRQFARDLHRVGVDDGARLLGDLDDLLHREHDAGLVVGPHQADDRGRAALQRVAQYLEVDLPQRVHRQLDLAVPHVFEAAAGAQHSRMLDARGDDLGLRPQQFGGAVDRHVVTFGAAAREDNLRRFRVEKGCHAFASALHVLGDLAAKRVHAGGVAVQLVEERCHGVAHFRGDARRGIIIEIDRLHKTPLVEGGV
ncbi:MAG: hypothetical protein BWX70_03456 [Verrucomicrobia bacterium ADurb.Bin070]|nr:MAG: hypothetical protein BWX70_03456 [Verrucomicrobia bacterium ADurb.Bin070]